MTRFGDALSKAYARREQASRSSEGERAADLPTRAEIGIDPASADQSWPTESAIRPVPSEASRPPFASSPWTWPAITERLLAEAGEGFLRLADRLRHGSLERNISSVAFRGTGRQIGRSTVLLTLARAMQESQPDEALLLIDADISSADLASSVGLSPTRGLWEVLQSDIPPESVLQIGPGGRLALLPLCGPVTPAELETVGPEGLLPLITELREQFPLILIDAGPVDSLPWSRLSPLLWNCAGIDTLVHVQRAGLQDTDILQHERLLCRETGMEFLGVIDTFTTTHVAPTASAGPPLAHFSTGSANARSQASRARTLD